MTKAQRKKAKAKAAKEQKAPPPPPALTTTTTTTVAATIPAATAAAAAAAAATATVGAASADTPRPSHTCEQQTFRRRTPSSGREVVPAPPPLAGSEAERAPLHGSLEHSPCAAAGRAAASGGTWRKARQPTQVAAA